MTHDQDSQRPVIQWLLEADPALRWQVMRDLAGSADEAVAAERSRVAVEGWGARLLALQGLDGNWGDGSVRPQWFSTLYTLLLLRGLGVDPVSAPARAAVGLVRDSVNWGHHFGHAPFFEGEEEACINGGVLALGGYFGEASDRLVDRLVSEQLADGGWNCAAPRSRRSSFHSTICVLEGLLAYEQAKGATATVTAARRRGQEYLLVRRMFRRQSTGDAVDHRWMKFSFPTNWHYDVLRGLHYLRDAGIAPDDRVDEAVGLVTDLRQPDGRWPLWYPRPDPPYWWGYPVNFELEAGAGNASRWITLRALRVLRWHAAGN